MNKRSLWLLIGLVVLCVAGVTYIASDSARQDDLKVEMQMSKHLQALLPQPTPGILMVTVKDGFGEVIFMDESPEYFKNREYVNQLMDDVSRGAFAAVPELEEFRIIVPFDRSLSMRSSKREAYEGDQSRMTADVISAKPRQ